MNMYPMRFPYFLRMAAPFAIFTQKKMPNTVYLTFDDGPTPDITEWVLKTLEKYDARATFFCLGRNLKKHPSIVKKIIAGSHRIANHSYFHVSPWKLSTKEFIKDVERTEELINTYITSKKLFRPPYGRITPMQFSKLKTLGYQVVFWTHMSGDFNPDIDIEDTIWYISKKTKSGDIIVFHDNQKAADNLKLILPEILYNLQLKGFEFGIL